MTSSVWLKSAPVILVAILILAAPTAVRAARVSVTINQGPLGFSHIDKPTLPAVDLTGLDQITTGNLGLLDIRDARGTGAGWRMTARASDFINRDDPSRKIKTIHFSIPKAPIVTRLAGNDAPESFSGRLDLPLDILSSPNNGGMGHFQITPQVTLGVPADTYRGTYDSTLTITLFSEA